MESPSEVVAPYGIHTRKGGIALNYPSDGDSTGDGQRVTSERSDQRFEAHDTESRPVRGQLSSAQDGADSIPPEGPRCSSGGTSDVLRSGAGRDPA